MNGDNNNYIASLFDEPQQPQGITLSEFNARIVNVVNRGPGLQRQWVIAETSGVSVRGGHCYLQLIEKNPDGGKPLAKVDAVVWASTYSYLAQRFFNATGAQFGSDMKVLVNVTASFHSQYGLKLVINDINPEFTLGEHARLRRNILNRLASEGIIDMNKQLPWPLVPQRVAIVSTATAAGYGDFINHLHNNDSGLQFYTCLFQATMQGVNTVPTVLAALDRINDNIDLFDCVVIIRGGGATSDLNDFDNYDLAATIAQFPIPVIVGIGHERDVTVLDYVAARRVKTPTAAAHWLIEQGNNQLEHLEDMRNNVINTVRDTLGHAREQLAYYANIIPATVQRIVETSTLRIQHLGQAVPLAANSRIATERNRLDVNVQRMVDASQAAMQRERMRLRALDDKATLLSPQNTLDRGYSLVWHNGKSVTDAAQLQAGEQVTLLFKHGKAAATVQHTTLDNNNN